MTIIKSIPAYHVYRAALIYAQARGLPFFTSDQQDIALKLYTAHAQINN